MEDLFACLRMGGKGRRSWAITEPSDIVEVTKRLRAQAAALRADAIREQLSFALTLCALAENDALSGWEGEILSKVHHTIEDVGRHLNEPNHVPPEAMDDLRQMLAQLEARARWKPPGSSQTKT